MSDQIQPIDEPFDLERAPLDKPQSFDQVAPLSQVLWQVLLAQAMPSDERIFW